MKLLFLSAIPFIAVLTYAKTEPKARKPASQCGIYFDATTTLDQAFEKMKATSEKNGLVLSDCKAIAKEAVNPDASAPISSGGKSIITRGVKTSSVYSCKTDKKFQAFYTVYHFQPIENASFNGFNAVDMDCPAQAGEFVTGSMSMLSK